MLFRRIDPDLFETHRGESHHRLENASGLEQLLGCVEVIEFGDPDGDPHPLFVAVARIDDGGLFQSDTSDQIVL